jgi:O-methyltransferase
MAADVLKTYHETIAPALQKPLLKKWFKKVGLGVYRYQRGHVYCPEKLVTKAMRLVGAEEISPFAEVARRVIEPRKTLLGYDRLYTLYQAVCNVKHTCKSAGHMAEVGVFRGGGTYFIASVAQQFFDPSPTIHAIDTFEGHFGDDIDQRWDNPHLPGEVFTDTSFVQVKDYLSVFPNVRVHQGRFQDRCADIAGEAFSLAHIDVDLYEPTLACLEFFERSLVVGGILVVDDYGSKTCEGVQMAVDEFAGKRDIFAKIHLLTKQCMLIRVA